MSDVDGGSPLAVPRAGGGFDRAAGVVRDVVFVAGRLGRDAVDDDNFGLGVALVSIEGSLDLLGFEPGTGVLIDGTLTLGSGGGAEASDMGGEGGS